MIGLRVECGGEIERSMMRARKQRIPGRDARVTIGSFSGRAHDIESGIELPVSNGYSVRIELTAMDYYEVSRVFKRGQKLFIKGVRSDVDCFELAQAAYYASCFRSYDAQEWVGKR